jgi:hypothetical protein
MVQDFSSDGRKVADVRELTVGPPFEKGTM